MEWKNAFVAMSIALGASREEALASLGAAPPPLATALLAKSRAVRARALAETLATVARDVAALELVAS